MRLPKLTPLQSRFAVSLTASVVLVVIYVFLWTPRFAYAAELEADGQGSTRVGDDHNWARIRKVSEEEAQGWMFGSADQDDEDLDQDADEDEDGYSTLPSPIQHLQEHKDQHDQEAIAILDKRDTTTTTTAASSASSSGATTTTASASSTTSAAITTNTITANNDPSLLNIEGGNTQLWIYANTSLWGNHTDLGVGLPGDFDDDDDDGNEFDDDNDAFSLTRREATLLPREDNGTRTIYIAMNTCLQPTWNGSTTQTAAPPQLTLYVSNTTSNKSPGPDADDSEQVAIVLDHGFAKHAMNASESVYMAVHAPALPENYTGVWNYGLAVSIDGYYYEAHMTTLLYLVDTDTNAALLVTDNLTQANASDPVYQRWMNLSTPFIVYAQNDQEMAISGLEKSVCGLQTVPAQITAESSDPAGTSSGVQMGMITRGLGNKPKEQFYIQNLNASSNYHVYLAMDGNSTASGAGVVGGGGQVWPGVKLQTKSGMHFIPHLITLDLHFIQFHLIILRLIISHLIISRLSIPHLIIPHLIISHLIVLPLTTHQNFLDGNCALLFNLTFCNEVAYAVPSNNQNYADISSLGAVYDSYAASMYENFNYSLQQIPCNTTSSAQYSLAKTCDDCASAYKTWLCAVTMPRCEDWSNNSTWLQPRNMAQRFVNSTASAPQYLDQSVLAAAYVPMEKAPSDSAAWRQTYASVHASNSSRNKAVIDNLVQPGPYKEVLPCNDLCYSLVQSCPAALGFSCPAPGRGLELDYGKRNSDASNLTCSYLGAVYYVNAAVADRGGSAAALAITVAGLVSLGMVLLGG